MSIALPDSFAPVGTAAPAYKAMKLKEAHPGDGSFTQPSLTSYSESILRPDFRGTPKSRAELAALLTYECPGVYSAQLFTDEFLGQLRNAILDSGRKSYSFNVDMYTRKLGADLLEAGCGDLFAGITSQLERLMVPMNPRNPPLLHLVSAKAYIEFYKRGIVNYRDPNDLVVTICLHNPAVGPAPKSTWTGQATQNPNSHISKKFPGAVLISTVGVPTLTSQAKPAAPDFVDTATSLGLTDQQIVDELIPGYNSSNIGEEVETLKRLRFGIVEQTAGKVMIHAGSQVETLVPSYGRVYVKMRFQYRNVFDRFLQLPTDAIGYALRFASIKDIVNLSSTCKALKEICSKPFIWKDKFHLFSRRCDSLHTLESHWWATRQNIISLFVLKPTKDFTDEAWQPAFQKEYQQLLKTLRADADSRNRNHLFIKSNNHNVIRASFIKREVPDNIELASCNVQ